MSRLFLSEYVIVLQVLTLVGKIGATGAFTFIYLVVTELMPTVVRNMGVGVGATSGFFGTIISPFVLYLGKSSRNLIAVENV